MDLSIIPECYIDTNLIETLVPDKGYNHQKGCGTVTRVMKERFSDSFALAIIDKDKKEVDYLNEFSEICNSNGLLYLHQHKSRPHYIIQICPAIERFILTSSDSAGISLGDFNLPNDLDSLKKLSKTITSKNDNRFKGLFKALLKSDVEEIRLLKAWVVYLKSNKYNIDIKHLLTL
jgi:hypothetical protein